MNKRQPQRRTELSPEFQLISACLRWPDSSRKTHAIRSAATAAIDWTIVAALTERHRVGGLVEHALNGAGVARPDDARRLSRDVADRVAWSELSTASEAHRLQTLFEQSGCESLVLKGVAVAVQAFGRLGLRVNRDLDLLVKPECVDDAVAILVQSGYRRTEPAADASPSDVQTWRELHKDMSFEHSRTGLIVELHWRLFDNTQLLPELHRMEPVLIDGGALRFRALPLDFSLIYMCQHGAQHAWSRLKWLADVTAMVAAVGPERLNEIYSLAKRLKADRAFAQALALCNRLFDQQIPDAILREARSDWRVRVLERMAIRAMTESGVLELEETRFGTTQKNLSHYLLADGFRYWLSEALFDLFDNSRSERPHAAQGLHPIGRIADWLSRHA